MALATPRWFLPVTLGAWAIFTAWLVHGFPPSVDLPMHGAQLQTMVQLLRGDPATSEIYQLRFQVGYGLIYWLFLPVAWFSTGGLAVRAALWFSLQLFPLSLLAMLRVFKRSDLAVLWGLPLAFNLSYWYGFLSCFFAQSLAFFTVALCVRALDEPRPRRLVLLSLGMTATLFAHLLIFCALVPLLLAVTLVRADRWKSLARLGLSLTLPALLAAPMGWSMFTRATSSGDWPENDYAAMSHVMWFFRNYIPEGVLAVAAPLVATIVLVGLFLRHRRVEPVAPLALFLAACCVYLATPKTLAGIFLISVRLPVIAAALALLLTDAGSLPRWGRGALTVLALLSLAETARFHVRFKQRVEGLDEVVAWTRASSKHGYVLLGSPQCLGSRHIYLAHLGEWLTADGGGVGHDLSAGVEHLPVQFRPGRALPGRLLEGGADELAWFDELVVFGTGPTPPELVNWLEVQHVGAWRRLIAPRTARSR